MRKIISLILAIGICGFTSFEIVFAQPASQQDQAVVDQGNKICPVSGEKIEEKNKATYVYEGKIYNFCCAGCIDEFKKDPQKYIKKVEDELKAKESSGGQTVPDNHQHQH